MASAIRQLTPQEELDRYIDEHIAKVKKVIARNLQYAGNEGVNAAKANHNYKDQTGNLTSSVGCIVVSDGKVVGKDGFEAILEGGQGAKEGEQYAERLAAAHSNGETLIVVAGMEYAAHVSNKGYDVLDSAYLKAKQVLEELMK